LRTRSGEYLVEESLTQLEQEFGGCFVRFIAMLVARPIDRVSSARRNRRRGRWSVVLEGVEEKSGEPQAMGAGQVAVS